jgi:hypothetical protein
MLEQLQQGAAVCIWDLSRRPVMVAYQPDGQLLTAGGLGQLCADLRVMEMDPEGPAPILPLLLPQGMEQGRLSRL